MNEDEAEAWEAFKEMRAAMKKVPFTERAQMRILKELEAIRGEHDVSLVLWRSTKNGWRDIYPDDSTKRKVTHKPYEFEKRLSTEEIKANAIKAREIAQRVGGAIRRVS